MKMKTTLPRILLLLALVLVPFGTVQAQSPDNGGVFLFGQNYTLNEGEVLNGSIAVFGGNVQIEKDAVVNGSIAVFGGNINVAEAVTVNGSVAAFGSNMSISGEVYGDLVIFGGNIMLTEGSLVDGDIATFGGQVTEEPGSKVTGDITYNTPPEIDVPNTPGEPNIPGTPETPFVDVNFNPWWEVANTFGQAIAVAAVGMLLTLFLQPQLDRAGSVVRNQPFVTGGYGLLALIVGPVVIIILSITIILIPIALIVFMAFPLAWVFGMVVIGQEIGDRFAKAINQVWAPVISTGLGTFALVLLSGLMSLIPCVGWLGSFIIFLLAIGVTVMSRFGTYSPMTYPPVTTTVDQVPPAS